MAATDASRQPLILEIKGNSLDDGPGIRSVVFFKGCPLDCAWCHNPESKRAGAEMSFEAAECVACDSCLAVCEKGALSRSEAGFIDRARCDLCLACVEACPTGALSAVGRSMTVEEVAREVLKDLPFFRTSGGGVTLSGGEPTLFMEYCSELLAVLGDSGVHRIVETCGFFDMEGFRRLVLPRVEAVYFDIKLFDDTAHRELCGVSNSGILENFRLLTSQCETTGTELLGRVPLVPGMTASHDNLKRIASFLKSCGAKKVAVLDYNPLWPAKSEKIGRPTALTERPEMTEFMEGGALAECRAAFDGFELV